ncbi:MAG: pyridoxal phosphate-dependent aminotransferase [Candidatus Aminicenantes bacterium]|nr:pyridoxal phosphate-dependent aminotransferase [Candidatus Aminicenantes bacterium]
MRFEPVAYMEWAKFGSGAALNLARSGLPGLSFEDLGLDLRSIQLNGDHPYGWRPLIEAIAGRYGAGPDSVVPTIGTSQAVFLVCAALLNNGDGVYVEKPAYEPLLAVPRALGADIRRFNRPFERRFGVDPEEFEKGFPKGVRLVVLTNLHNPSGVRLAPEDVRTLAGVAARHGALVLVDEVYLEFLAAGNCRTSFGLADNIIVISSLTKAFGLAGLRCGWVLAPPRIVPAIRRVVDHLYVEHVFPSEQLSARVFPLLDELKAKSRVWTDPNRAIVREFIESEPRLQWIEPDGGIVAFPRVVDRSEDGSGGDRLARRLRETLETSIVPGGFFEDSRHFRLGFGLPASDLRRGLENIRLKL